MNHTIKIYGLSDIRKEQKMKQLIKRFLTFALMLSLSVCFLSSCSLNKLTDRSLKKMLEQNEDIASVVDVSSVNIAAMEDLDFDEYDELILINGKLISQNSEVYYPIFANTEEDRVKSVYFEAPFSMLMSYITYQNENTNIQVFNKMAEYIKNYGIDYFSSEENAANFMNDITINNNIIDIKTARTAIFDQFVISAGKSSEDVEVFFEKGTAIPKYLSVKGFATRTNPNWGSLGGYGHLLDRSSQNELASIFGPEYVQQEVWQTSSLSTGSIVGNFDTIDEIKNSFNVDDTKTISTNYTNSTSGTSAGQIVSTPAANNPSPQAQQTEDLYRSDLTYKRMDDIHNSVLTDNNTYNKISQVITDFDNKCEQYMNTGSTEIFQYLRPGTTAYNQQTQYKQNHPNMMQYYNSVYVRTTRASGNYYYAWVRENIQQTENGTTKTVEDNWVYKLSNNGGQWYIEDYTVDPLSK